MPFYVICGKSNCPNFAHAIHVAQYLNKHLPRFEYQQIEKSLEEWGPYVTALNKKQEWYVTESPLIWKEITMWGGKKYLIGGLSEFWEYVYCYYGLKSSIPRNEITKLASDNLNFFQEKVKSESKKVMKELENQFVIGVLGVGKQTPILIYELLELKCFQKLNMAIKLFDTLGGRDTSRSAIIDTCRDFDELDRLSVVYNIESALMDCDILIYMYDVSKNSGEAEYEWLSRIYFRMQILAENINDYATRNLRIIINCHGPSCFMASILLEYCTRLRPSNIVVVTSDEGLPMLNIISKKTGLRIDQLSAPPVWGFIGINSYVDEKNIIFKAAMYRPYERALTAPRGATLPLGTMKFELRLLSYLVVDIDHDELMSQIEERRQKVKDLGSPEGLPKIRALISLLQQWYADSYSDNIISLGIYSDASFGLPTGMIFSQPVKLDETGKWVPYSKFPLMNDCTREQIAKCAQEAKKICENFIIPRSEYNGSYDDMPWEDQGEVSQIQIVDSVSSTSSHF